MNDPRRARQQRRAKTLRLFRKVHRTTGALLFAFFFVLACTGLLLGWKKHTGGLILPRTYIGTSTDMREWLPVSVLHERAIAVAGTRVPAHRSRIDSQPLFAYTCTHYAYKARGRRPLLPDQNPNSIDPSLAPGAFVVPERSGEASECPEDEPTEGACQPRRRGHHHPGNSRTSGLLCGESHLPLPA